MYLVVCYVVLRIHQHDTLLIWLIVRCVVLSTLQHDELTAWLRALQYDAKKRAELVSRKVEENRVEYKQLMIESLLPPAQNICSAVVHIENAIR